MKIIIAIPKSASTSLMATLGNTHSLVYKQVKYRDKPMPEKFPVLARYHSDIREYDSGIITSMKDSRGVFKQHVCPTDNNIDLFSNFKKVILLRPSKDIIAAYRRAELKGIHAPKKEFGNSDSIEDWMLTAKEVGLFEELECFKQGWEEEAKSNPDRTLLVYYDHLVSNPSAVIHSIETFWGLASSGVDTLVKKRYSRKKPIADKYDRYVNPVLNKCRKVSNRLIKKYFSKGIDS